MMPALGSAMKRVAAALLGAGLIILAAPGNGWAACPDIAAWTSDENLDLDAARLLRHAEQEAQSVEDPTLRVTLLAFIAWSWTKVGGGANLEALIKQISDICSTVSDPMPRGGCYSYAAWAYAAAGDVAHAREAAEISRSALLAVPLSSDSVLTYADLAFAQAEAGMMGPAGETHRAVLEGIDAFPNDTGKVFAFSYLAGNWTIFDTPTWALEAIDHAEETWREANMLDRRLHWMLSFLALAEARVGDARARANLELGLVENARFGDRSDQALINVFLADGLIEIEERGRARELLRSSLRALSGLSDPYTRTNLLIEGALVTYRLSTRPI